MAVGRGKFLVLQAKDGSVGSILVVDNIPWKDIEKLQNEAARIFEGGAHLVIIAHEFVRQANSYHGAVHALEDLRRLAEQ